MGLAHGNAGGVRDCPQRGNYCAQYRLFFVESWNFWFLPWNLAHYHSNGQLWNMPATSLLFFFRLKAVYRHSRIIITVFGIFWLAIAGLSIFIMLSITINRIPYTQYCFETQVHGYNAIPIILTTVNDTLVFLAISYRMVSSAMVESTWKARTKSFFTGNGLLYLSKILLQSGQVYYFVTIGAAILASVLILSENIHGALRPILSSPYFALASAMACRVFRNIILEVMEDTQLDTLDIVNLYRSNTSDLRHHDDRNDQKRSFA